MRAALVSFVCVLLFPAVAFSAPPRTISDRGGGGVRLATDGGRTLAVWFRAGPSDDDGRTYADVVVRVLDRSARPLGPEVVVGTRAMPDVGANGMEMLSVAVDPRRRRFVVAWPGREDGMAQSECTTPGIPGLAPPPCFRDDREIFARVVGRDGQPVGPARRVTTTGPQESVETTATAPSVAYHRRSDRFVVVHTITGSDGPRRGRLGVRRLRPDGSPAGAQRGLPVFGGASSLLPLASVASVGRRLALVFLWARRDGPRELYAQRLRPDGRPAGRARTISPPGGPGAGGVRLAVGGRRMLVVWVEARPGSEGGVRARRVDHRARPRGRRVAVRLPRGTGAVVPAARRAGRGWLYAFTAERRPFGHHALTRGATPAGRPAGPARRVSDGSENALEPSATRVARRRFIVAWSDHPPGPGAVSRVRARSVVAGPR